MAKPYISQRAQLTPPSPIRKLSGFADQAKAKGISVHHLNIGQPDIPSPQIFLDALRKFRSPVIAYESSQGLPQLCSQWCEQMNRELRLDLKTEDFIITTGASEALIFAFMACCDPEDEIIVFDPTYANYLGFAALSGVSLVPVPTYLENNFALPSITEIASRITQKTRAILLCNPNNPTGTVYSRKEVRDVLELCASRGVFLIMDETYREFLYDDLIPFSVFELNLHREWIIVVDSLSKRYSLCGARIGVLITQNEDIRYAVLKMAQARLSVATIEQHAAAFLLEHITPQFVRAAVLEYAQRRNVLCESFSQIEGVKVHTPQGAFYAVVGFPVDDAEAFCRFLLEEFALNGRTTFLAPASGFYFEKGRGQSEVRVAYVLQKDAIREAISIIASGLKEYQSRNMR